MRIGLCGGLELAKKAAELGFAYLEPPVNATAALSDEAFAEKLAAVKEAGIPCLAFNMLYPGTLKLLPPETTKEEIAAYLHKAFARVRALGGQVVVFGSGASRRRPEDMSYGEAFRRLAEVTRLTGEVAAQYGLTVVVEPLNRTECNIINSMAEGAALVAMTNLPNVKLLCDDYHVALDNEPLSDIVRLGGVSHVHVATKALRRYPLAADEALRELYAALKATKYDGLLSIEGNTDNLDAEGPAALRLLASLWENA